jgi:cobalt/nickel transport system permease protein
MHIPDGLMDPTVSLIGWIEFVAVFGAILLISGKRIKEKNLPRVAVMAAGIFAAQMLNFPIGGGTTGHLIGGALFAIVAGPIVAMIGMTVVLLIQCLLFGDGGLTAFGLNAVNMALIAPLTGYGVYTLIRSLPVKTSGKIASAFNIGIAAWASVFVAAAACAAELVVSYAVSSGTYGIGATISIPAMLGLHAIIGVGEAIITVGVVTYLLAVSPSSISMTIAGGETPKGWRGITRSNTTKAAVAILVVFALALPLYFLYASNGKDGLEKTMESANALEGEPLVTSPFGYGESYFEAFFAGILGFLAVALVSIGVLKLVGYRSTRSS